MIVSTRKVTLRKEQDEGGGFKNARVLPTDRRHLEQQAKNIIKNFIRSGNSTEVLPPMPNDQRKVVHEYAQKNGILTKSHGKEPNRYMMLSLRQQQLTRANLTLTEPIIPNFRSLERIDSFIAAHPIRRADMVASYRQSASASSASSSSSNRSKTSIPVKSKCSAAMKKCRDTLPATKYRDTVIHAIDTCNVVIISGGTGCGKTTQVPQFILENACDKEEKVRVMVTQPRRIAAISIAERVAKERGEPIGTTVGYHVRLESKLSERTVLTYCTTGVLLRTLTANPNASGITHIVVDEIHEREINTDYLLIALRECLKRRNYLKLVLMSATIEGNMGLFEKYFCNQSVDIIRMESKLFDVKVFYLDQILAMCGYEPPVSPNFFAPLIGAFFALSLNFCIFFWFT
uniref:Probable ATP-dependent RNA helicase spindle-E n=1 Tax=Caenorhabditis japonica TaxID=281687 RepID=A0A8R1DZZ7_CAEJA